MVAATAVSASPVVAQQGQWAPGRTVRVVVPFPVSVGVWVKPAESFIVHPVSAGELTVRIDIAGTYDIGR